MATDANTAGAMYPDPSLYGEFRPLPDSSDSEAEKAVRRVANAVHRANDTILRAVDAGISVELIRVSRYRDGRGNWSDQMVPTICEGRKEA